MSPAPRRGRAPRTASHVPAAVFGGPHAAATVAQAPASPAATAATVPPRLLLVLDGDTPYGAYPLREGNDGLRAVRLRAPSGTDYYVARDCFGVVTCSCPDATYRPKAAGCKHARALVAVGLLEPPGPPS